MSSWFPKVYDKAMRPLEKTQLEKVRADLIRRAQGRVLEIGFGTGANFRYYRNVERIDAIEPNPAMSKQAASQIKKSPIPIYTYRAIAEELPFTDNTFDSVVATLVFCTIPDPIRAMQEICRVSRPGAKILLFEHVKMNQKILGHTQEALTPIWRKICDGCHLNRDTLGLVEQSGLDIQKVSSNYGGLFLTIECNNPL